MDSLRDSSQAILSTFGYSVATAAHPAAAIDPYRKAFLEQALEKPGITRAQIEQKFFEKPLYQRNFDRSFVTLYTAVYDPTEMRVKMMWPTK